MKKFFCFSLIVMFLALSSSPLLVKADDVSVVTPYVDSPTLTNEQIYELENATLFLEYLRNGGTIDVANTSSDYDANDLLSDFGDFVREVIGDVVNIVNPFQTEIEYHGLQPITPSKSAIVQFMGALPFYALNNVEDNPQFNPPVEFSTYIDKINGSGFDFLRNLTNFNFRSPSFLTPYTWYNNMPWSNYSFFMGSRYYSDSNWAIDNIYISAPLFATSIQDVNIISSNGEYTVTILNQYSNLPICYKGGYDSNTYIPEYGNYLYSYFDGDYGQVFLGSGYVPSDSQWSSQSYTGTLENVFSWLTYKCRNVNIYVDGVPWSIVNNNTNVTYNINISTGTTVPIKDGTGKVEWLYDYEIYFDIDRIQDDLNTLLNEIRNNPQSPTIIKYDDLDDVIVDVNGQPAVAVKVLADSRNIDQIYIDNYGPIIPAFLPLFTPVIDDIDIIAIADTAVSPIPDDLLEVFGYMFMGVLFVGFIHRLLE